MVSSFELLLEEPEGIVETLNYSLYNNYIHLSKVSDKSLIKSTIIIVTITIILLTCTWLALLVRTSALVSVTLVVPVFSAMQQELDT